MTPIYTIFTCPRCDLRYPVHRCNLKRKKTPYCKTCATIVRNIDNAKHGLEQHPLYQTWANMLKRIDNPMGSKRNHGYAGLDVDPEWRDVRNFLAWALATGWAKGMSIERRDNKQGYWPDNCHWIPVLHQARNRRDNSMSVSIAREIQQRIARGEIRYHVAKDVANRTGISLSTVNKVAYGYNWVGA